MNKKWWFGVLMLLIFVVGLSIASVNAEGGSHEVSSDATGVVSITKEEAYESLRQHGVSEEVIEVLRELDSRLDQLDVDGASDEEAEAIIEEANFKIQQLERHDKGTKSSGNP